jgi:methionyl-tRNA formyltransferase
MRLVFMGTPEFSVPILAALLEAGHEIVSVYTQPPRPVGRGQKVRLTPVHAFAEVRELSVRTPKDFETISEQVKFSKLNADVGIVVAYGLILPASVFNAPRLGCMNVHASLLPRWRGAAPIQRAILAGDSVTGISIMNVEAGLDTGKVVLHEELLISGETTAGSLHDALADKGAHLMVKALAGVEAGVLCSKPQGKDGITYAPKLQRYEGLLDWSRSAVVLERQVRALNPWPGTWFEFGGQRVKVLAAKVECNVYEKKFRAPGTTIDDRLGVSCGSGVLRLSRLCRAGKAPQDAASYLRGFPISAGISFL